MEPLTLAALGLLLHYGIQSIESDQKLDERIKALENENNKLKQERVVTSSNKELPNKDANLK